VSFSIVLVRTFGLNVTFRTGLAGRADSGDEGADGVGGADVGRRGERSVAVVAIVVPRPWLGFSDRSNGSGIDFPLI
jgi:hypothetical protein